MTEQRRRRMLRALREEAAERAAAATAALDGLVHDRESSNDDDEHDPEGVTLSSEWSRLSGLAEAARAELRQIDDAQDRLDAGSYGVCVSCGRPIPEGRLDVRPFADRCVACASAQR